MLRYDVRDGVALCSLFEVATDPGAFGMRQQQVDPGLVFRQWSVVEIRRIVDVMRIAGRVDLERLETTRRSPPRVLLASWIECSK